MLVHAGAGGVGLLLTQMVRSRGGRVISTVSTDEKADLARAAGAQRDDPLRGLRRARARADGRRGRRRGLRRRRQGHVRREPPQPPGARHDGALRRLERRRRPGRPAAPHGRRLADPDAARRCRTSRARARSCSLARARCSPRSPTARSPSASAAPIRSPTRARRRTTCRRAARRGSCCWRCVRWNDPVSTSEQERADAQGDSRWDGRHGSGCRAGRRADRRREGRRRRLVRRRGRRADRRDGLLRAAGDDRQPHPPVHAVRRHVEHRRLRLGHAGGGRGRHHLPRRLRAADAPERPALLARGVAGPRRGHGARRLRLPHGDHERRRGDDPGHGRDGRGGRLDVQGVPGLQGRPDGHGRPVHRRARAHARDRRPRDGACRERLGDRPSGASGARRGRHRSDLPRADAPGRARGRGDVPRGQVRRVRGRAGLHRARHLPRRRRRDHRRARARRAGLRARRACSTCC